MPPATARIVVPGLYGYVSATKWVVDLEVTRFADFSAYWSDRGWAEEAPVKPKRTRTRKVAAAAPATEVVAEAAAPVAEEAPAKPKRTRTRKVAASAPEAPAAEAAAPVAEEAPAKPKRTRTRKAVAAVETPEA